MTDEAALNTIAHLERALAHSEQERERDRKWVKSCIAAGLLDTRKRAEAEAELASLQVELGALRDVRDQLQRDLATAEQIISDLDDESTSRVIDDLTDENRQLRTELAAVNQDRNLLAAAAIRLAAMTSTTSQGEPS